MSNSIFDDDDGFTLSGGFDGEERKKAPSAPINKAPAKRAPEVNSARPNASRPQTSPRQETTAPVRPANNASPRLPVKPTASKPLPASLPTQQRRQPVASSLPTTPVRHKPVEPEKVLPPAPVPVQVEPENITYTQEVEEELHDSSYNPPVDHAAEAKAAEERALAEEREREQRRLREREAIEREREREEAEEREREERRRIERERRREEERKALEQSRLADDDNYDDDEDEEEAPKKSRGPRSRSKSNAKAKPTKKGATKKEKEPGRFSGGRRKILIIRIIAFTIIGIFILAGAQKIFVPPQLVTAEKVTNAAKKGLGLTNFPVGNGEGFVIGFSKIYLTLDEGGTADKNEALLAYMPQEILAQQQVTQDVSAGKQTVTAGPFVSGVKYVDDTHAVYTVTAQVNNARWLYIDVPVVFDPATYSFAISGTPAYVPAPDTAEVIGVPKEWSDSDSDVKVATDFEPSLALFFEAWAASDAVKFKPYITEDANTAAKSGLDGIATFKGIVQLSISPAGVGQTVDPTATAPVEPISGGETRKARVSVQWESTIVPGTIYGQTYDLVIKKVADQWRIQEIKGGIPAESGSQLEAVEEDATSTSGS